MPSNVSGKLHCGRTAMPWSQHRSAHRGPASEQTTMQAVAA
ncbi:hypothetical protein [Streptomyces olivaceus]